MTAITIRKMIIRAMFTLALSASMTACGDVGDGIVTTQSVNMSTRIETCDVGVRQHLLTKANEYKGDMTLDAWLDSYSSAFPCVTARTAAK